MTGKHRVLYFTCVPFAELNNGGSLCCFNHVARLSQDSGIDLSVASVATLAQEPVERQRIESLGVRYDCILLDAEQTQPARLRVPELFRLPVESWFSSHAHAGPHLAELVDRLNIQTVVVDYLYSFYFCRDLVKTKAKLVYVALNREAEFFLDSVRPQLNMLNALPNMVRWLRCIEFENRIFASCERIICLSAEDIPRRKEIAEKCRVITPYLDSLPLRWQYSGSKDVLFVGAVGHYPNWLACRWLIEKLAPCLRQRHPESRIVIVSRQSHQFSELNIPPNVHLLHDVDDDQLDQLFARSALFISPIENTFGVKFKILKCLSHGTPFLASEGCLVGLPFLTDDHRINLNDPDQTATRAAYLIDHPNELIALSDSQSQALLDFKQLQRNVWSGALL